MAVMRKCEYCHKPFTPKREHGRFCSSVCRVYANREGIPPGGLRVAADDDSDDDTDQQSPVTVDEWDVMRFVPELLVAINAVLKRWRFVMDDNARSWLETAEELRAIAWELEERGPKVQLTGTRGEYYVWVTDNVVRDRPLDGHADEEELEEQEPDNPYIGFLGPFRTKRQAEKVADTLCELNGCQWSYG